VCTSENTPPPFPRGNVCRKDKKNKQRETGKGPDVLFYDRQKRNMIF
jgi:hypothetical protein